MPSLLGCRFQIARRWLVAWVFVAASLAGLRVAGEANAAPGLTDPNPVAVGAGSYAAFPPAGIGKQGGRDVVGEVLAKPFFLDESLAGKPVPTNQWWTDLLVHAFGGNLWADPLVVKASPDGCNIFFPSRWNAEGRDMVLENPLEVRGEVIPKPAGLGPPPDVIIADFEGTRYPAGWKTTGTAFGAGPTQGSIPGQTAVSGFLGKGLANSMQPDDAAKGTLTSPAFTIQRRYIHFLLAGGRRPDELRFKLLTDGGRTIARSATGDNSEQLKWQTWDVGDLRGRPASVEAEDNAQGGWAHLLLDQIVESDSPTPPAGDSGDPNRFAAADARVLRWGDWTVAFRLRQSESQHIDVTLGHGLPFVWLECRGVTPLLHVGADAVCSDERGAPLQAGGAGAAGDQLAVKIGGSCFGLYAPDGSVFQRDGENLRVKFAANRPDGYLVVAALPAPGDLAKFHAYAFAIPRDSQMAWTYDPAKGEVQTHWKLNTAPLKGTSLATLQGWAPHHYRDAIQHLAFNGVSYPTARGIVKCAPGQEFELDYPFTGLLPNLPYPQPMGNQTAHDFADARMRTYLSEFAQKNKYGNDTYWGGKDVLCMGRYLAMASEAKDGADAKTLEENLHGALADWFTYTPGEKAHFFARYPRWQALVGFEASYGSEAFNDQHFHYGYFTTAAALLGMYDAQFLKDYGPMARLVAKEYANWERNDPSFPFLRTFDVWEGHSWAGGYSSGNGNNQESSSEAVQSWGGVFLLGAVLGDDAMTAAGAMGYAMEVAATREYWFDYFGHKEGAAAATFSPAYAHHITGILGGGGRAFATYFSGDPAWIYGIQWLPASPFMTYLGQDPEFARWQFDSMWAERTQWLARENARHAAEGKTLESNSLRTMGALGTVLLGYAAQANPDWAAAQMDELWAQHNAAMTQDDMRGIVYYLAHADRALGPLLTNAHTSVPTSAVFHNSLTGRSNAIVYNPRPTAQIATMYRDGRAAGTVSVPAKTLVSAPMIEAGP